MQIPIVTDIMTDLQQEESPVILPSHTQPMSSTDTVQHTIEDVLERPILLGSGAWTNGLPKIEDLSLANYRLFKSNVFLEYNFPQDIFTASLPVREKLGHFSFLKADIEFEIKINANKFQAGSLMIVYNPYGTQINRFRNAGSENLASRSSLPRTILNLEESNSAKLVVPYANIFDYFNLDNPDEQFGTVQVYLLTPLRGLSDSEVTSYTCFARFIKPEYHTPRTLTDLTRNGIISDLDKYVTKTNIHALNDKVQAALRRFGFVAQISEGEDNGPVSKIGNVVHKTVGVVEQIGKLATWPLRIGKGLVSAFGFSKPIASIQPSIMIQQPGKYMGNTEGNDYSHTLALIHDNFVVPTGILPVDKDEMDLNYVLSVPNLMYRSEVTLERGKLVCSWRNMPNIYSSNTIYGGTFVYTCLMCKYWRGTIKYRLRLMKTQYHSGRMAIVYFPGLSQSPDTIDDCLSTNYNFIFNLSDESPEGPGIYDFAVPYISEIPWMRTMVLEGGQASHGDHPGCIGIYALSDIVVPEAVNPIMDYTIEHCAGSDFELALPSLQISPGYPEAYVSVIDQFILDTFNGVSCLFSVGDDLNYPEGRDGRTNLIFNRFFWTPPLRTTLASGVYLSSDIRVSDAGKVFMDYTTRFEVVILNTTVVSIIAETAVAKAANTEVQSSIDMLIVENFVAQIGDISENTTLIDQAASSQNIAAGTMGEYFVSLRGLIKRFSHVFIQTSNSVITYTPHSYQNDDLGDNPGLRSLAGLPTPRLIPESYLSLVSYLYRFRTGGSRVKILAQDKESITTSLSIQSSEDTSFGDTDQIARFEQFSFINNVMEVLLPYYSITRCLAIGKSAPIDTPQVQIVVSSTVAGVANNVYEAAADDTNFFFLVGPPVFHPTRVVPVNPPIINL